MRSLRLAPLISALTALLSVGGCSRTNPTFNPGQRCGSAASAVECQSGAICDPQAAICVCPGTMSLCGSACVELSADGANCGACGLSCPAGESCAAGRCAGGGCPTGAADCGGVCVDPTSNAQHCGGCAGAGGRSCDGGEACVAGVCTRTPCPFGATQCAGSCVELDASAQHCGACGNACAAGQVCSAGLCVASCAAGLTPCGSACVDLKHDATNCGSCGTTCSTDQVCAADGTTIKCRDYKYAGCNSCPCAGCGDRSCCKVPNPTQSGYSVLCVEDQCPLP